MGSTNLNITSTFDASGVQAFVVSVGEGVEVTKAMQEAINLFSSQAKIAASSAQELAAAWNTLSAGAEKLNLQLVKTAAGFELIQAETAQATGRITAHESALASAAVRLGAIELGAGRMGYALSIAARSLGPMAGLFAAAFPAIFIATMIELIVNLVDKLGQLRLDVERTGRDFEDLATASIHQANALEISNLKMEDTINKLQGISEKNRLAEALIEVRQRAEEVSKALADAEQKALTLLTTKTIGEFKSLFVPYEATSDIASSVERQLSLLASYQTRKAQLELTGTQAEKDAINEQVKAQRDGIIQILENLDKESQARKKHEIELSRAPILGGIGGKAPDVRFKTEEELKAEVDRINTSYSQREIIISSLITQLREEANVEAGLKKEQSDRVNLAIAQNVAEAERRKFALQDPKLKEQEKATIDQAALDKKTLDDKYNLQVAELQKEAAYAILTGQNKYQVEQDLIDKIRPLREKLAKDEIAIEQNKLTALKNLYDQEATLIKQTKPGDDGIRALQSNNAAREKVVRDGLAAIQEIRIRADTDETKEYTAELNKQIEAQKAAQRQLANDTRDSVRQAVDDAATKERETVAAIEAGAEEKLRIEKKLDSDTNILFRANAERELEIIKERNTEVQKQLEAEKQSLAAQQQYVASVISTLPATSEAVKELTRVYLDLQKAIDKVTQAQQQYTTKSSKAAIDAQIDAIGQLRARWSRFFDEFNRQFTSVMDEWLRGSITMGQAFRRLFADILIQLANFVVQWLLKKAEMWILDKILSTQANALMATGQVATEAAVASAAAFADAAMMGPEGLAAAPGIAAGAYATVIAMEALIPRADVGGSVAATGLAVIHKDERVFSAGLMDKLNSVGGGGSTHNYNLLPGSIIVQGVGGKIDEASAVKLIKRVVRAGGLRV